MQIVTAANNFMNKLVYATQKMQNGYENLMELKYHHEALTVMKEQAALLTHLARLMPMNVDKHEFYVRVSICVSACMFVCMCICMYVCAF